MNDVPCANIERNARRALRRGRSTPYATALLVFAVAACGEQSGSSRPQVSNAGAVPQSDADGTWGDSAAWKDPAVMIGSVSSKPSEIFGRIREVEIGDSGDVFILDDQALTLHWFGPDGTPKGVAGRGGGGPGEFRAPVGLELDRTGRLWVADMAHRRISIFTRDSTGLQLDTTISIPLYALDFCLLGPRLYVLSSHDGYLVHELSDGAAVVRSFAAPTFSIVGEFARHATLLTESYTRGRLLCDDISGRIILVHDHLPDVRAFDAEGNILWATALSSYRRLEWVLTDEGRGLRMRGDPNTGTAHTLRYVAMLARDTLAITLSESGLADPEGSLTVRMLAAGNGRELGIRAIPVEFAGAQHGNWFGLQRDPFPAVLISHDRH